MSLPGPLRTANKSLEAKLGQISRADKEAAAAAAAASTIEGGAEAGEEEEDAEMGEAFTVPLEEAFMSRTAEGEVRVRAREKERTETFTFFFGCVL